MKTRHLGIIFSTIIITLGFTISWYHGSSLIFFLSSAFTCFILCRVLYRKLKQHLISSLKKTNWWNNNFLYTHQFVSNEGYRRDLERNYEIVNLGSNPALFALRYDDVKGCNWASGTQGPDMDLAILQLYHSYIRRGGIVLIPIVPFSSCSPYLWHHKKVGSDIDRLRYKARFHKILQDGYLPGTLGDVREVHRWLRNPIRGNWKIIRYIYNDVMPDRRMEISEQPLQYLELRRAARAMMKCWMDEFDLKDLDLPLDERMESCHEECADKFAEIIDFCKERDLRPILILPPITRVLRMMFSDKAVETYIYSFIRRIQKRSKVTLMDYLNDEELSDSSLYFDSLFMNARGRRIFSERVLAELGLRGCGK